MVFMPSLDQDAAEGFFNMVDSLLDDVFHFGSLVPRVATHLEANDYRVDLDEVRKNYPLSPSTLSVLQIAELSDMREEIMSRVQAAIEQAEAYLSSHASRSHLWTDDRHEFLHQFLKYGHVPTLEEIEAAGIFTKLKKPFLLTLLLQVMKVFQRLHQLWRISRPRSTVMRRSTRRWTR